MAYNNPILIQSFKANAALVANRFVKLTAADTVDYATGVSDIIIGVTAQDAAAGAQVPVIVAGIAKLECSGTPAFGTQVAAAAAGKGTASATTNTAGAIALQTAVANDVISAIVTPGGYVK